MTLVFKAIFGRLLPQWLNFTFFSLFLTFGLVALLLQTGSILFYASPGWLSEANLWRIDTQWASRHSGQIGQWATSPDPLARLTRKQFEGSLQAGRFTPIDAQIRINDDVFDAGHLFESDPPSLSVFDWTVEKGKPISDLGPGEAIITSQEALRLFGSQGALGQRIVLPRNYGREEQAVYVIGAIVTPFADNAMFRPGLVAIENVPGGIKLENAPLSVQKLPLEWLRPNTYTFVRVSNTVPAEDYPALLNRVALALTEAAPGLAGWVPKFIPRPASDILVSEGSHDELNETISPSTFRIQVVCTALLSLSILTMFGFLVVLAKGQVQTQIAKFEQLGIPRSQGIGAVAALVFAAAFAMITIAGVLAWRARPLFEAWFGINVSQNLTVMTILALCLAMFAFFALLGAGLLFFNRSSDTGRGFKASVTGLFLVVGVVTGACVIIGLQSHYIQQRGSGLNLGGLHSVTTAQSGLLEPRLGILSHVFMDQPQITDIGFAQASPGAVHGSSYMELRSATDQRKTDWRYSAFAADDGFIRSTGIKVLAGELPKRWSATRDHIVLNELAILQAGFSSVQDAIGKQMLSFETDGPQLRFTIAAVVSDIRLEGRHVLPKPLVIYYDPTQFRTVLLKFASDPSAADLEEVNAGWALTAPHIAATQGPTQQVYDQASQSTNALSLLIMLSGLTTLCLMSCALFAALRFGAITYRKVLRQRQLLGAGLFQLAPFFLRQVSLPFVIGVCVAIPMAVALGGFWLESFQDRFDLLSPANLTVLSFVIVCTAFVALMFCVALELLRLSVSFHRSQ